MSMLVNSFVFGGTGGVTPSGALVYASTSLAGTGDIFQFDTETYDRGGWHDSASNPGRLTIPSGVTRVRISASITVESGDENDFVLRKGTGGGTPTDAYAYSTYAFASTGGADGASLTSPILTVAASNQFDLKGVPSDANAHDNSGSWFAIEKIDPTTSYALVSKSTGQSLSAGTAADITWDTTGSDVDGWHDAASNSANMVVISGVSLVRLTACAYWNHGNIANSAKEFILSMQKNGGSVPGLPRVDHVQAATKNAFGFVSAILAVTPGDAFKLRAATTDATTIGGSSGIPQNATWFQIEKVDAATKYCLVYKAATQAISANTDTAVTFTGEAADTEGAHSTVSNTSRIVSPATATQWRATFNVLSASATGQMIGVVRVNGANAVGMPQSETDNNNSDSVNGMGAWIDIANPGTDYCELIVFAGSAQTLPIANETWLCVEFR